jgi:hypothetical protein
MSWLNPAASLWLLLVPVLVLLYMLRPRSLRKQVSSLRLWQRLPQVDRPRARLRRPPLSLLLLMQALLLLAGAFALMQPAFTAPAGQQLTIIVDASGSMQTASGTSTRFEQAKSEAARIASNMRPQDHATLLRAGANLTTACSACDRAALERAVSDLRAGAGRSDLAAALAVASGLAGQAGNGTVDTDLISDGAFSTLESAVLPAPLHFVQVGSGAANVGITALSARRPPNGTSGYTALARVDNMQPNDISLEVRALADTVPMQTRQVALPAWGKADINWQVPAGTQKLTVSIEPHDALAADDRAVLFLPSEGKHKVAIRSGEPGLYLRALAGIAGLEPITGTESNITEAVFTIVEGAVPDPLPPGSLLLVNPTGTFITTTGELENATVAGVSEHPLLAGVDLRSLLVQKGTRVQSSWLAPVVQSDTGPLLLAGERDGRRVAVLTFDPRESNLPKLAAFPLLMANMVDWLYPLAGAEALRPGEPAYLSPGSVVAGPDGRTVTVGATGVYADTDAQGIYTVSAPGKPGSTFAVNMTDRQESGDGLRPHPELERPAEARVVLMDKQEYWSPLAALALVLVGAEWLFYCWKRGSA